MSHTHIHRHAHLCVRTHTHTHTHTHKYIFLYNFNVCLRLLSLLEIPVIIYAVVHNTQSIVIRVAMALPLIMYSTFVIIIRLSCDVL